MREREAMIMPPPTKTGTTNDPLMMKTIALDSLPAKPHATAATVNTAAAAKTTTEKRRFNPRTAGSFSADVGTETENTSPFGWK